jgi:hypothetical protein
VTNLYSILFEFGPHRTGEVPDLAASPVSFDVHGFGIALLAPIEEGPVQESLQRDFEGPFEACIRVEDRTARPTCSCPARKRTRTACEYRPTAPLAPGSRS